jgi:uncharacterized membrane protein YhaH (DUF805 family)
MQDYSMQWNSMMALVPVFLVVMLVLFLISLIVAWRITVKAGYTGVLSLLLLIPVVNFVMLLIFAFSEWPIQAKLRAMKSGWTPPQIPQNPPTPQAPQA